MHCATVYVPHKTIVESASFVALFCFKLKTGTGDINILNKNKKPDILIYNLLGL
jgi:hypothetical protein